ncbi:MAG: hypothetical protein NTW37_13190 [Proteobacteria bacterium]|nr:hypothetical protein [Pseudomonadota bacterium]
MKRAALLAGILAAASSGSFAQSSTYIAAGIGTAKVSSDIATYSQTSGGLTFTHSADTNGTAFGLLLGRNFNSQWSLEGGYLNIRSLSANASLVATNAVVGGNTYNGSINARQISRATHSPSRHASPIASVRSTCSRRPGLHM